MPRPARASVGREEGDVRRPLRILLVDPDPETRTKTEKGLSAMGFLVTSCADEQHALGLCFAGGVDAVIVDLELLVSGELRLTRRLRDHVPFKSLPILGLAKPGAPEVPLGSGLDRVIAFQDDPHELFQALHRLRQQRGFLASPEPSSMNRHWS